jgi:hypothetical protein
VPLLLKGWRRLVRQGRPVEALQTLERADLVAQSNLRHYRQMARTVLRWYVELEDGVIQTGEGQRFDARVLDYRIDVERVFKRFHPTEVKAVLMVNRDGLTHAQAVTAAGIQNDRPDRVIADIETRLGQAFERLRLDEFLQYVDYLR